MGFAGLIADTKSQFAAVLAAPIPFVLVAAIVAVALFRITSWHFSGRIDSLKEQIGTLDGRLRLRDEEILHLKHLVEAAATRAPDAATQEEGGEHVPSTTQGADASRGGPDYFMPWRVYIPPDEREFVDFDSLLRLLDSLADATSARRAALVKPYLRKWVRIDAAVLDVDVRDEETCVSSMIPGAPNRLLWMHHTRDRDGLVHLARGDEISLVGWIEEADRTSIRLYGCERTVG